MRLLPHSFFTEGSSHSKRISTNAILALTSLPNIFMDVVASLTHDPLPKCYIKCTRVQRLKFILPTIVPQNLIPRNLILGTLSSFSRKFLPTKITRYTVVKNVEQCLWMYTTYPLPQVPELQMVRLTEWHSYMIQVLVLAISQPISLFNGKKILAF